MSITASIFRKDFTQLRILFGLLVGMLVLLVAVRLELTGSVAPDPGRSAWSPPLLEGMLVLFTVVLGAKLAAFPLYEDSPGRADRFLATRPVPAAPLALAKLGIMVVLVVVPFGLAAAGYLALSGMPARVVWLGTLQSFAMTIALLAFAAAFTMLWENRWNIVAGAVAIGVGLVGTMIGLAVVDEFRPTWLRFDPERFVDRGAQLVAVALAALGVGALAWLHLRRRLGLGKRLVAMFLVGCAVPPLAGLLRSRQAAAPAGEVPACAIVSSSAGRADLRGEQMININLTPGRQTPDNLDVDWQLVTLTAGERELKVSAKPDPRSFPDASLSSAGSQLTGGIEAALVRQLGHDWAVVSHHSPRRRRPNPAWARAPEAELPAGGVPLDAVFRGQRFSWRVVAELPLEAGASARDGAATWTCHGIATAMSGTAELSISLSRKGPVNGPGGDGGPRSFERSAHRYALADPERRLVMLLDERYPVRRRLAEGTACPRYGLLVQVTGFEETRDLVADGADRLRLMVLRPSYEGAEFCRWSSQAPVDLRASIPARNPGLARDPQDLAPDDVSRWIEDHPAPAPDAAAAEVARHVIDLLDLVRRCPPHRFESDHPAVVTLAGFAPAHLDILLRALESLAVDQHGPRRVLRAAIVRGVQRDQLPALVGRLPAQPELVGIIEERGWAAAIAPDLARLIRSGSVDDDLIRAAARLPGAAGIGNDEWLEVFRIRPDEHIYDILRTIPGLGPELDAAIDRSFADSLPVFADTSVDPLLELALARGHPQAPARLQQALRYAMRLGRHNADFFANTLARRIDLGPLADHHNDPQRIAPWFLAQDPDDFVFNPDARRFELRIR